MRHAFALKPKGQTGHDDIVVSIYCFEVDQQQQQQRHVKLNVYFIIL